MTSVFSLKNSVSLCRASFCTPRPNLFVTPDFLLLHSYDKKDISFFFFMLVLEGLVALHRNIQPQPYLSGHRVGLL